MTSSSSSTAATLSDWGWTYIVGGPGADGTTLIDEVVAAGHAYVQVETETLALSVAVGAALGGLKPVVLLDDGDTTGLTGSQAHLLLLAHKAAPSRSIRRPQSSSCLSNGVRYRSPLLEKLGVSLVLLPTDQQEMAETLAWAQACLDASRSESSREASATGVRPFEFAASEFHIGHVSEVVADVTRNSSAILVSTSERFAWNSERLVPRDLNFHLSESTVSAAGLALGLIEALPSSRVIAIDDRETALTDLDAIALVTRCGPEHFIHLIVNDAESRRVESGDLTGLATFAGYREVFTCNSPDALHGTLCAAMDSPGPIAIMVRAADESPGAQPHGTSTSGTNVGAERAFLRAVATGSAALDMCCEGECGAGAADQPVILVAGSGRSGTTWVAGLLEDALGGSLVFEPLNRRTHAGVPGIFSRPYLRPLDQEPEWHTYLDRYLRTSVHAPSIVKEIRIGGMLAWICTRWSCTVYWMLRDPVAVVESRIGLGWQPHLDDYAAQSALVADYLTEHVPWLEGPLTPDESHAAMWAIENLVPWRQRFEHPDWWFVPLVGLRAGGPSSLVDLATKVGVTPDTETVTARWRIPSPVSRPDSVMRPYAIADDDIGGNSIIDQAARSRIGAVVRRFGLEDLQALALSHSKPRRWELCGMG